MGLACTKQLRKFSAENPSTAPAGLRTPTQPVWVPAELLKGGGVDPQCVVVSQALERRLAASPSTASQAGCDPYFDKPELFQGVAGDEWYPPMRQRRATISGGELVLLTGEPTTAEDARKSPLPSTRFEHDALTGRFRPCQQSPTHEGQGDHDDAAAQTTREDTQSSTEKMVEELEKAVENMIQELQGEEHEHVDCFVSSATAACRRALTDCYGGYGRRNRLADEVVRCRASVDDYKAAVIDIGQQIAAMKAAVLQGGAHAAHAPHAVSFANPVVTGVVGAAGAGPQVQVPAEPVLTSVTPACEVATSTE